MRKLVLAFYVLFICSLYSEVDIRGFIELDKRFVEESFALPNMYNTGYVEIKNDIGSNLSTFLSSKVRFYDNSNISSVADLSNSSSEYPYDFFIWEAYGDIYELFNIEGLDLRLGKQMISWGTADKITPTNILNPNDFTDVLNISDTIPVFALKLDYTFLDNYSISYIWQPKAAKVLLPRSLDSSLFDFSVPIEGMNITKTSIIGIENQANALRNSVNAVKLKGNNFNIDWSLSYYHGYEDIMLPNTVDVNPVGGTNITEDIILASPRIHMVGFDVAGELASIGYWAEFGLFIPEDFDIKINLPGTTKTETILDEPYLKYTLGLDYTFSTSTYINLQYNHGFFTELGKDNLDDYIFFRVEQKLLNNKIKLTLGTVFNTDSFEDIDDNYGLGILPEIAYMPYDDVELSLGAFLVFGTGDVLFAKMRDNDQVYLRAKYNF